MPIITVENICYHSLLNIDDFSFSIQNTNITTLEVGPQNLVLQDNHTQEAGPLPFVTIPPGHYCTVNNPIDRRFVILYLHCIHCNCVFVCTCTCTCTACTCTRMYVHCLYMYVYCVYKYMYVCALFVHVRVLRVHVHVCTCTVCTCTCTACTSTCMYMGHALFVYVQ